MIDIDGSFGEGGGQILRTSLALSLVTGKPFRIGKIRAERKNPGLLRQHLTAVNAAATIGQAEVTGDSIGSAVLSFTPRKIVSGDYHFAVGTAGSTTLILQTVLPALSVADGRSHLTLEGGTHNPFAPPFDFLTKAFLPLLARMGVNVTANLDRYGFYPAGGGKIEISINSTVPSAPARKFTWLELNGRSEIRHRQARVILANLPRQIGEREIAIIRNKLSWPNEFLTIEQVSNSHGPGNIVMIEIGCESLTEVFTGFGEKGLPAEEVADQAVQQARRYLAGNFPVGEYLADQLLIPMALSGGGSFTTGPPSRHTTTNIEVIGKFLDVEIVAEPLTKREWKIGIRL
ncbi:MAG: RNA 3'-terminal phosphate cyclase [Acidobacteria bacterium]|nr:RNA 3'-terminal phosphate cyclase [Acidobacteriota bacterium]